MNRTQLSLTFDDEEVYNNLILPLKSNRSLTDFVLKLLTMYYYNDEFKSFVLTEEERSYENMVAEYDEYFRDIRLDLSQLAATQDELESSIKDGYELIRRNAKERDVDENLWGKPIPRLSQSLEESTKLREQEMLINTQQVQQIPVRVEDDRVEVLEKQIEHIMNMMESFMLGGSNQQVVQQPVIAQAPVQQSNHLVEQTTTPQYATTQPTIQQPVVQPIPTQQAVVPNIAPVVAVPPVQQPQVIAQPYIQQPVFSSEVAYVEPATEIQNAQFQSVQSDVQISEVTQEKRVGLSGATQITNVSNNQSKEEPTSGVASLNKLLGSIGM